MVIIHFDENCSMMNQLTNRSFGQKVYKVYFNLKNNDKEEKDK